MNRATLTPLLAAAGAVLLGGALVACDAEPADDGRLEVVASFYPLQYVAEQIGGTSVDVSSLTPKGAEPHDIELSPAQTRVLSTADLVVNLSGFQPAVDEAIESRQPAHVVDAAEETTLRPLTDELDGHDHDHDEGGHEDHDHDHGQTDPHFWLDPTRLVQVGHAVAEQLGEIDPDNRAQYESNADRLETELTDLDEQFRTGLTQCRHTTFVTTHAAFGYLADRYDLEQLAISGVDPDGEPSPARIKEVSGLIADAGVTTVFFERLVSPKVAETLAGDLGLTTDVLDPIESQPEGTADYRDAMTDNLTALRTALECS